MTRPVPPAWAAAVDRYLATLTAGGSPATTRATRRAHLHRAARILGGDPVTVTSDDLVDYLAGQTWAVETRRAVRSTLRSFFQWMRAAGLRDDQPAETIPGVASPPPTPRPTPEIALSDALHRATPRVRMMIRLSSEAGLRRSEVATLHTRDIIDDLHGRTLMVRGKGGRVRLVPLSASLDAAVRSWIGERGEGYFFAGLDGGHLSPRHVGRLVSEALPGGWTMHSLRHRFATRAYGIDRDTFTVQRLLGHASPATTARYVAVADESARATVEGIAAA